VRLRERREHPWPYAFERLADEIRPNDAGWDRLSASRGQITARQVEPGSEERLRNFVERIVPRADAEMERIQAGASEIEENFRRLAGYPPGTDG
jgi:hypothetical protein